MGSITILICLVFFISDIPNAFQSQYQTAPLDFATDSFYLRRSHLIEAKLMELQTANMDTEVKKSWDLHLGTLCHGVLWELLDRDSLSCVAKCIGGYRVGEYG